MQVLGDWGRLGNQLFQIASTIGIARKNNCDFVFPHWSYAPLFERPLPYSTDLIEEVDVYYEQSFEYQDIRISKPTSLIGHFQSEKYFCHCAEEIRYFFTLKKNIQEQLDRTYARYSGSETCSVHVRRTDYVNNPNYVDLCNTPYYEDAIKEFDPNTSFLFFSDDIAWCKQRFRDERFIFIESHENYFDLALMSRCDNSVIANSSFSWWGAWLNTKPNKKIVAPRSWFAGELANPSVPTQPGPPELRGFCDTKDLIPENWTRL